MMGAKVGSWACVALVLCGAAAVACNRAGLRFHGASGSFHAARTGYVASSTVLSAVRVALPTDTRAAHYGEQVAGTRWTGCSTDPFADGSVPGIVAAELERELRDGRVFAEVLAAPAPSELVLDTEIRAFCAQAWGFVWLRVAGISALRFTLRDGERVLYERTIEKVVTDADDAYTGSQVTTIEQAMKVLVSDSLREVLRELLPALGAEASSTR
jgi:hypothetical protein